MTMGDRDQRKQIKLVPFQRLPAEIAGSGPQEVEDELNIIRSFVPLTNSELEEYLNDPAHLNDPAYLKAKELLNELGSDQTILAYAFNFFDVKTGTWNENSDKLNSLNSEIYEICSISNPEQDPMKLRLSSPALSSGVDSYGREFIDNYANRLGVIDADSITFLISTTMNPRATDVGPPINDFLAEVEGALRDAVYQAMINSVFA